MFSFRSVFVKAVHVKEKWFQLNSKNVPSSTLLRWTASTWSEFWNTRCRRWWPWGATAIDASQCLQHWKKAGIENCSLQRMCVSARFEFNQGTEKQFLLVLVAQSCLTLLQCLWTKAMDYSLPDSSVNGVSQIRILERVPISFSRGSSWLKDWTVSPAWQMDSLPLSPQGTVVLSICMLEHV